MVKINSTLSGVGFSVGVTFERYKHSTGIQPIYVGLKNALHIVRWRTNIHLSRSTKQT